MCWNSVQKIEEARKFDNNMEVLVDENCAKCNVVDNDTYMRVRLVACISIYLLLYIFV